MHRNPMRGRPDSQAGRVGPSELTVNRHGWLRQSGHARAGHVLQAGLRGHHMFKRLSISLFSAAVALAVLAPGAAADPKGAPFTDTCDNGQTVELTFNGNGNFTPGHVVGGTATYVVQSLEATQVRTPSGGPTSTTHFSASKPNIHGDLVTCTFDITRTSPEGTLHAFGTLVAVVTPVSSLDDHVSP